MNRINNNLLKIQELQPPHLFSFVENDSSLLKYGNLFIKSRLWYASVFSTKRSVPLCASSISDHMVTYQWPLPAPLYLHNASTVWHGTSALFSFCLRLSYIYARTLFPLFPTGFAYSNNIPRIILRRIVIIEFLEKESICLGIKYGECTHFFSFGSENGFSNTWFFKKSITSNNKALPTFLLASM